MCVSVMDAARFEQNVYRINTHVLGIAIIHMMRRYFAAAAPAVPTKGIARR
jgi:hypothetical protein